MIYASNWPINSSVGLSPALFGFSADFGEVAIRKHKLFKFCLRSNDGLISIGHRSRALRLKHGIFHAEYSEKICGKKVDRCVSLDRSNERMP